MSRLNVNTASREELIDVVRRLNSKVSDAQAQHKLSQQQHAEREKQLQSEIDKLNIQVASVHAVAGGGGGVGSYLSEKFSALTGGAGHHSAAHANPPAGAASSIAAASMEDMSVRIASLESELESERNRYKYDTTAMQEQIDLLTIRAADDAEAMQKLRGAAEEMKALARQHEETQREHSFAQRQQHHERLLVLQRQQQQQQQQRVHTSSDCGSEAAASAAVEGATASFTNALTNLADERDAAILKGKECGDETAVLQLSLQAARRENHALASALQELQAESAALKSKCAKADRRLSYAKDRSREKYDKLYERFALLKKRFEIELVEGPSEPASVVTPVVVTTTTSAPPPSSSSLKLASDDVDPQRAKSASASASSSSSSSRSSSSRAAASSHEATTSANPVSAVSSSSSTQQQQQQQQRKAVIINAAQLVQEDDDREDDDDDGGTAPGQGTQKATAAMAAAVETTRRLAGGLPFNTSFDAQHAPVLGFANDDDDDQQKAAPAVLSTASSGPPPQRSIRLMPLVDVEVQCDDRSFSLVPAAPAAASTVSHVLVAATILTKPALVDSHVQCEILCGQPTTVAVAATPLRNANGTSSSKAVEPSHSTSAAVPAAAASASSIISPGGGEAVFGSVAFEHDVQLLGGWDTEDMATLKRLLRF